MSKLENASGNFLEMVKCVQEGMTVQYNGIVDGKWYDGYYDPNKPHLSVEELCTSLTLKWRKKPDAFEEAWLDYSDQYAYETPLHKEDDKNTFYAGWNAAMEHKK